MEQLNNFAIDGAIALAVDFNIRAEIPSGPFAWVMSRDLSSSQTSSSVHMMLSEYPWSHVEVLVEIGGQEELKQLEKNASNALALSSSDMQVVSPCVKEPIEAPCLFRTLMVFQNFVVLELFKLQK